jgi:hypothetical protein
LSKFCFHHQKYKNNGKITEYLHRIKIFREKGDREINKFNPSEQGVKKKTSEKDPHPKNPSQEGIHPL